MHTLSTAEREKMIQEILDTRLVYDVCAFRQLAALFGFPVTEPDLVEAEEHYRKWAQVDYLMMDDSELWTEWRRMRRDADIGPLKMM